MGNKPLETERTFYVTVRNMAGEVNTQATRSMHVMIFKQRKEPHHMTVHVYRGRNKPGRMDIEYIYGVGVIWGQCHVGSFLFPVFSGFFFFLQQVELIL